VTIEREQTRPLLLAIEAGILRSDDLPVVEISISATSYQPSAISYQPQATNHKASANKKPSRGKPGGLAKIWERVKGE